MNKYSLEVRGQAVHLTFTRINDSRRLKDYYLHKNPNLFGVRAAMLCYANIPATLSPKWQETESGKGERSLPLHGVGFCSRKDQWKSQTGRHRALAEALKDDFWIEASLREEIVAAFTAEEQRRTKVKGPARQQKTSGPKPRRPGLRKVLAGIQELLEKIASQDQRGVEMVIPDWLEHRDTVLAELIPVAAGCIRPADTTAAPTPSPFEKETTACPQPFE